MNEIESLMNEIDKKDSFNSRNALIEWVKNIEKRFFDKAWSEVLSGRKSGGGLRAAKSLSDFRDSLIKKIIGFSGGTAPGITILAVGGYGRGELSPYSDIDLLILHTDKALIERFAHDFITLLWDCGYHMGYSVRTLENLAFHAREDIRFMTSLFEARYIDGEISLFVSLEETLKKIISSFRINYLKSQMEQLKTLLMDPTNEILLKEPDIKNSVGGLRSVHLMEWLNFAFTGSKGLTGLKNTLPSRYFLKSYLAYDFLMYIRNVLHIFSSRKNDRLLMDDQFSTAGILFPGMGEADGTKKLMRKYYDKSLDIFLSLLYIIDEFHLRYLKRIKSLKAGWGRTLEGQFIIYNKRFYVKENSKISVENAFQAIYLCCRKRCLYTFSLINFLRKCARLMSNESRKSRVNFYFFRKILSLDNASQALTIMKYSEILYEYLPAFKKIKHLIIYNPYHQFTVDQHAIETVHALTILKSSERDQQGRVRYGHFIEVYAYYKKNLWPFRLALLLHDIGKAFEGDHSKNGVEMAGELLSVLPIKPMVRGLILFLIDNHLLLSNLVRRSNISDPFLLRDLAGKFIMTPFPREYFEALYIMTYCDIYSTKAGNLKGYVAELLTMLYKNTKPYLDPGAISQQREFSGYGAINSGLDMGIVSFIKDMGTSYSLQNLEDEIRSDYKIINSIENSEIKINVRSYNDYFKVKIFASDRKGLFSFFCGVLALNGADIVRAVIRTYKGIAFDEFTVTRIFGIDFKEDMLHELDVWSKDLERLLKKYQSDQAGLSDAIEVLKKRIKRHSDVFYRQSEVRLEEKSISDYALEISGMDRPALLYEAATYISNNDLEIQSAHIDTMGWYVHDIFDLKSSSPLSDNEIKELTEGLKSILDARLNPGSRIS